MRNDNPRIRERRRQFAETCYKKLVGQAMKPVAPNAGLKVSARQGERLSERRLVAMKGRIKTSNLRNLRSDIHDCADGGEIVRLVKRRQWRERPKIVQNIGCYAHGAVIPQTAMNDPVTECGDRLSSQQSGADGEDLAHGGVMIKTFGWGSAFLDGLSFVVGDLQARRNADPADLTAEETLLLAHGVVECELDAGRAGIDHCDGFRHGHLVVRESACFCLPFRDNADFARAFRGCLFKR